MKKKEWDEEAIGQLDQLIKAWWKVIKKQPDLIKSNKSKWEEMKSKLI